MHDNPYKTIAQWARAAQIAASLRVGAETLIAQQGGFLDYDGFLDVKDDERWAMLADIAKIDGVPSIETRMMVRTMFIPSPEADPRNDPDFTAIFGVT